MLLKIAIPTFNRNEYLIKCLDSLLISAEQSAIQDLHQKFEIHVYDNNESLELSEIILTYSRQKFSIKYSHNVKNIGSDANIAQCYRYDKNFSYVHTIGDDDCVLSDYFDSIIPVLEKNLSDNRVNLIFLNAFGYSDMPNRRPYAWSTEQYSLEYPRFIERYNVKTTFISSLIFKLSGSHPSPDAYIGSSLVQTGIVLSIFNADHKVTVIKKYLIAAKRANSFITNEGGFELSSTGKPIYNNMLEIFLKNYFNLFQSHNLLISRNHRNLVFCGFVLGEVFRRGPASAIELAKDANFELKDLLSYQIFRNLPHPVVQWVYAGLVNFATRIFSGEFLKIVNFVIFHFPKSTSKKIC